MAMEGRPSTSAPQYAPDLTPFPPSNPDTPIKRTPPQNINDRLSLPLRLRLPLSTLLSSMTGLVLGLAKGAQDSGYRFRAENAHRLPHTQTGWFLYHKSKNYNMMLGGIQEGLKQSIRFGMWTGLYFVLEEGIDRGRAAGQRQWKRFWGKEWAKGGKEMRMASNLTFEEMQEEYLLRWEDKVVAHRDFASSMLAGLGTAGLFSAWNRFPLPTAARTAKMGAKAGLVFGLLQDVLSVVKGRRVWYIGFLKRHTIGEKEEETSPPV